MISMNVSLAGGKKESVKLRRFKAHMIPGTIRGIDRATSILEKQIKHNLSIGGRAPRRKGESRTRNTGVNLRIQDGTLRSSWRSRPAKRVSGGVEGHVASPVVYSAIHEFGGQAGRGGSVTIPARPYVQPAIDKRRDEMVRAITREITKPLRTGA